MRDEHDRSAVRGERPHGVQEALRLVAGQRRSRLVHQQEPRITRNRAEDLDLLLVGGAERADDGLRLEAETRSLVELVEAAPELPGPEEPGRVRLDPEHHVLEHRPGRHERDLLGDRRDPGRECVPRRVERDLAPVDEQLALVGAVHTADHLGQGGFPGAVLADEPVDARGLDGDRHALERLDTPEALRDPARFDEGVRSFARPLVVDRYGT